MNDLGFWFEEFEGFKKSFAFNIAPNKVEFTSLNDSIKTLILLCFMIKLAENLLSYQN